MSCTNCFSGCIETTSDKCVKYTGNAIEFLNIHTGDSLEAVEKAITDYLATVLNGLGILPTIDAQDLCTIVSQYFPQGDPTLVDILTAIVKAVCDIDTSLTAQIESIDDIEADYTVGCLTSAADAGTHTILQEVITKLCTAIGDIATLYGLLPLYVLKSEVNTYIQNYINTQTVSAIYTKMVPYVIYPFYPTPAILNSFAGSGAGFGAWEKIYYCNGQNGTPDLRGRSLIGVVNAMGTGAYNPEVDPSTKGNPDYVLTDKAGANSVSLTTPQLPAHTHVATVAINDPGHLTTVDVRQTQYGLSRVPEPIDYPMYSVGNWPADGQGIGHRGNTSTVMDKTGLTPSNVIVTNANTGDGTAHDNVHPVHACYYIMYIPI